MNVIYKITCIENLKYYIGSTENHKKRWTRHRLELRRGIHKNKNMQASWAKYGEAAFTFEVIEEVNEEALLMAAEQRHLDACVGKPDCFNHNKFADAPWRGKKGEGTPMFGKTVPPDVRAKISASTSGEKHRNWGKELPPELREKIKRSNLAYPHHENRHTDEAKAKIAAAGIGRPQSLETRYKRSQTMQGHEVSTMTRMKISKALQGDGNFWYGKERPEHGEKVSHPIVAMPPAGPAQEFPSIQAAREAMGLHPPTINRALKSGQALQRGPYKGWKFEKK